MPVQDISGAVGNAMQAYGYKGALNAQNKANLVGGVSALGKGLVSAADHKALTDALISAGFDPSEAAMIAQNGPGAAAQAAIDRHREIAQREHETSMQGAGFEHADAAREAEFGHDTSMAEMRHNYNIAENQSASGVRLAEGAAERAAIRGENAAMYTPGEGEADPDDRFTGALRRGADPSKARDAYPATPQQKPEDPSVAEARRAAAARDLAEADKLKAETANVGHTRLPASLTEEGIAAQLELEKRKAEQKINMPVKDGTLTQMQRERLIKIRQELQQLSRPDAFGRKPSAETLKRIQDLNTEHDSIVPPMGKKIGKPGEPKPNAAGQQMSDAKDGSAPPSDLGAEVTLPDGTKVRWDAAKGGYVPVK